MSYTYYMEFEESEPPSLPYTNPTTMDDDSLFFNEEVDNSIEVCHVGEIADSESSMFIAEGIIYS